MTPCLLVFDGEFFAGSIEPGFTDARIKSVEIGFVGDSEFNRFCVSGGGVLLGNDCVTVDTGAFSGLVDQLLGPSGDAGAEC